MRKPRNLYRINQIAAQFYEKKFWGITAAGKRARLYMSKRGVSEKVCRSNNLGLAIRRGNSFYQKIKNKPILLDLAFAVGLVVKKGDDVYDFYRDRIMIPIYDLDKHVVGFVGRSIDEGTRSKYINSLTSEIYSKGKCLFGIDKALDSPDSKEVLYMVEGIFDCFALQGMGKYNVVASNGTAVTKGHVMLMSRITDNVTLVFDGDKAGRNAMYKSLPLFLDRWISPKIVELPEGFDPDSVFLGETGCLLSEVLDELAVPLIDRFVQRVFSEHDDSTLKGRVKIARNIAPMLKYDLRVPGMYGNMKRVNELLWGRRMRKCMG